MSFKNGKELRRIATTRLRRAVAGARPPARYIIYTCCDCESDFRLRTTNHQLIAPAMAVVMITFGQAISPNSRRLIITVPRQTPNAIPKIPFAGRLSMNSE